MGVQAMRYRQKKLAQIYGVDDEFTLYTNYSEMLGPHRPCWCEWTVMEHRLLGEPPPTMIACACAGQVSFEVPGYYGHWGECNEPITRRFCQQRRAMELAEALM